MGENIIESIDLEIKESAVNCRKWVIAWSDITLYD